MEEEFLVPFNKAPDVDKIALIDADYIKYLVANDILKDLKAQTAIIYKNPVHHYTQIRVDRIINSFTAKGYLFCFSGPSDNTFRCSVSFDRKYKDRNYTESYEKELEDKTEVVKYIRDRYPSVKYNDLEADDLLSMLQDDETFIYSNDKDLLQVPGLHWNIKTKEFFEVSKSDGLEFLMHQMILGDSGDSIAGLKGSGKVAAKKLLADVAPKQMPFKVLLAYLQKHGMIDGIDHFVESWNLLKLRSNRGDFFLAKYKGAFDTLRLIKNN